MLLLIQLCRSLAHMQAKKNYDSEAPTRQSTFNGVYPAQELYNYEPAPPANDKIDLPMPPMFGKIPSSLKNFDPQLSTDLIKIPTVVNKTHSGIFGRSFSNDFPFGNLPLNMGRSRDEYEMDPRKKIKPNNYLRNDSFFTNLLNMPSLQQSNSTYQPNNQSNMDDMNLPMPPQLGKQNSGISQPPDDLPNFSRFPSTFSLMLDKN